MFPRRGPYCNRGHGLEGPGVRLKVRSRSCGSCGIYSLCFRTESIRPSHGFGIRQQAAQPETAKPLCIGDPISAAYFIDPQMRRPAANVWSRFRFGASWVVGLRNQGFAASRYCWLHVGSHCQALLEAHSDSRDTPSQHPLGERQGMTVLRLGYPKP